MRRWLIATVALLSAAHSARAEAPTDRFSAGGYLRVGTRPDFQGGWSKLGYWNLYGRLLNEGPWAALELKLDLLQKRPDSRRPWTSLRARIEGGSLLTASSDRGSLSNFRLSQLYVQAGDVLLENVTWQVGSLDWWLGDLGLYDMRPASVLGDTVGVSARYTGRHGDLFVGFGDAGWFLRGQSYSTVLSGAVLGRLRLGTHLELGAGFQLYAEPSAKGNRFAPHATPGVGYEPYARREVVKRFLEDNPELADFFPNPTPTSASSGKAIAYLGFGGFGPVVWNNFYAALQRRHPDQSYSETVNGREYAIYVKELTDDRWTLDVGNELRLTLVPERLDVAWGMLFGWHRDLDNTIAPSDENRLFYSTVVRAQGYLTETVHLLAETSFAREESLNGNLYRNHVDSIFRNAGGTSDPRGLEYGDSRTRVTWQGKFGPVLSPLGTGIYTRPQLRLLYGVQYSSQNNAFGNSFVESLDQFNAFENQERHWHHVLAVETEAWF